MQGSCSASKALTCCRRISCILQCRPTPSNSTQCTLQAVERQTHHFHLKINSGRNELAPAHLSGIMHCLMVPGTQSC